VQHYNVVLNLIFIPKYIVASATTVVTEFASSTLAPIWSIKLGYGISHKKLVSIVSKVLISSALMGAFIRYFYGLNLVVLIILSALLYFVVLYVSRGMDKEDISLIRRVVGKGWIKQS